MASPKELVECISDVLKTPLATVTVHDRNLAVAGLRTVNGRGRAVASVTADDAANLLIAVIASEQVRDSVKSVYEFGSLISRGSKLLEEFPGKLSKRHTLKDGLSELISLLVDDTLRNAGSLSIDVKIKVHDLSSDIIISNDLGEAHLAYSSMSPTNSFKYSGDLFIVKSITQVTLFTIAQILRGETKTDAKSSI